MTMPRPTIITVRLSETEQRTVEELRLVLDERRHPDRPEATTSDVIRYAIARTSAEHYQSATATLTDPDDFDRLSTQTVADDAEQIGF